MINCGHNEWIHTGNSTFGILKDKAMDRVGNLNPKKWIHHYIKMYLSITFFGNNFSSKMNKDGSGATTHSLNMYNFRC